VSLVPFVLVAEPLEGRGSGTTVPLDERARHHLRTVLRLRAGDEVELGDGAGGWAAAVLVADDRAQLRGAARVAARPRPSLWLAQGLPKARKLDEVVRVATELGVDGVLPVVASRSVTRLSPAKAGRAVERWAAVAHAATEQARRRHLPQVADPVTPHHLTVPDGGVLLVANPGAPALPRVLAEVGAVTHVTIAVGPEGGWTPDEVRRWDAAGARLVGLGPTVLRTEHAGPAALAVVAAHLGRWDG
jgi:16S rRNA (uracil1498-N3)-methyltransferase